MLGGSTAVASIEQPPDTMFQQLKRPLDMNSLEKGPPAMKIQRRGQQQHSAHHLAAGQLLMIIIMLIQGLIHTVSPVMSDSKCCELSL
jgi:hypothetical protein